MGLVSCTGAHGHCLDFVQFATQQLLDCTCTPYMQVSLLDLLRLLRQRSETRPELRAVVREHLKSATAMATQVRHRVGLGGGVGGGWREPSFESPVSCTEPNEEWRTRNGAGRRRERETGGPTSRKWSGTN